MDAECVREMYGLGGGGRMLSRGCLNGSRGRLSEGARRAADKSVSILSGACLGAWRLVS